MTKTTLAATLLTVALFTQAAPPAQPDFSAERIKAHVTFLADDLLEGREAGTRGHEIAARYIASQFALLGRETWRHRTATTFRTSICSRPHRRGAKPTLRLTTPRGRADSRARRRGDDPRPDRRRRRPACTAPLVFVGYGMKDAYRRLRRLRRARRPRQDRGGALGLPQGHGQRSRRASSAASRPRRRGARRRGDAVRPDPNRRGGVSLGAGGRISRRAADHMGAKGRHAVRPELRAQGRGAVEPKAAAALFEGAPQTRWRKSSTRRTSRAAGRKDSRSNQVRGSRSPRRRADSPARR